MNISIQAIVDPNRDDWNVIAESKGGVKNHVLVVDAHLDAIYGAGMLDNASGSATILDIAQKMKNVQPLNKLRFIWFGGEELGLLGSVYYVNNLSSTELSHIGYDLDADVTATPNYTIGVLDPAGPDLFSGAVTNTFPNRVYKASTVARDQAIAYFDSIGLNHELFSPQGTDAFSFNEVGIPASGLLTGQDCCKNQHEVDLFGGYLGNFEGNIPSFDGGCVDNPFLWCDNLSNNDPNVLTFMSKAFATMVVQMAFDTKVMPPATAWSTTRSCRSPGKSAGTRANSADGVTPGASRPAPRRRKRHSLPVVVVGSGSSRRLFRTESDHLLAAVQADRVVHDHIRDVVARTAVDDVGLVVVRERVENVFPLAAVLDVGPGADPEHVAARAAVDHVVAWTTPGDIVAATCVHDVVAVMGSDAVVAPSRVDDVRPGRPVEIVGTVRTADEIEARGRRRSGEHERCYDGWKDQLRFQREPPRLEGWLTRSLSQLHM